MVLFMTCSWGMVTPHGSPITPVPLFDLGMAGSTGLECIGRLVGISLHCRSMMFIYHSRGGSVLRLCSAPPCKIMKLLKAIDGKSVPSYF